MGFFFLFVSLFFSPLLWFHLLAPPCVPHSSFPSVRSMLGHGAATASVAQFTCIFSPYLQIFGFSRCTGSWLFFLCPRASVLLILNCIFFAFLFLLSAVYYLPPAHSYRGISHLRLAASSTSGGTAAPSLSVPSLALINLQSLPHFSDTGLELCTLASPHPMLFILLRAPASLDRPHLLHLAPAPISPPRLPPPSPLSCPPLLPPVS